MNDRPENQMNDEEIARAVGRLPGVEADPAFRERLRSAFVSGEMVPGESGSSRERVRERGPAQARPPVQARGPRAWQWLVPVAAAFAVGVAVVVMNGGPALRALEAGGEGYVRVGGSPILLADARKLDDAIVPGAALALPRGSSLDLIADGVALYQVAGGTRMTLPATPGRWFARAPVCSLFSGEIRMKTGAGFAGASLRVFTPHGMAVVTGTLLSIQCDENGTCVCVLEGTARVGVDESDLEAVAPGSRKIMMRDGTAQIIPIVPVHRDGVLDFDARVGDHMDAP